ncbi:MAG TPA: CstA-like transporter-associated (seleno)protein [Candidatus Dormibacteraeota bacterium]|nr:CstA-like transporter-associated (seleno)protein [Candidatus Dormibacteraeota bacterium]
MKNAFWSFQHGLRRILERIREWCGDASYERYERAMARKREPMVLSPQQFYVQQLERKYSRPNRCC